MPHQCVRCGTFYSDGAEEILKGCACGAKMFFYIKKSKMKKAKDATKDLSEEEKKELEENVYDILGLETKSTEPVILDFESINIPEPGKFEIDIVKLLNKEKPIVYKLEEGKYIIDLAESFKREKDSKD